jgi:uncharacterized phage protein (predicted DNA packaging)
MLLDDVKTSLRVSHFALDVEISDLIEAARHDLQLSGISLIKVNDEKDPLIKRAITVYVKANFVPDGNEAERFQRSYDMLKNHLTLAGDYQ